MASVHTGGREMSKLTESEALELLRMYFGVVEDGGNAVIVIGKANEIPIDRPCGARDLISPTRARRFDSARVAVRALNLLPSLD